MLTDSTKMKKEITKPAKGETKVANAIVEKIAFIAANEIEGVADLSPKSGGLKQILNLLNPDKGIRVEVGTKEVAIDLDISVEYGSRIPEIVRNIRKNITEKITQMTGLDVVELNINVNDLHVADYRDPLNTKVEEPEPRVR
jgi:uncharacterized alkaline shock family protein YloU